ncbi:MAG: Txe/YoeB family addiction module toxin [Tannerellaceae bacterium]|nr:Txe/YoeB family addiction module toxin [Tannerellaceae bacterium]
MRYDIILSPEAEEGLQRHARSGNKSALEKISALIRELEEHPTTGTGKPEPLKGDRKGQWSRRIIREHRLVYEIYENVITVVLISSYGHYGEK